MCIRTSLVAAVVAVLGMTTYAQADYITAVKADGPIAYWRFDGDSGLDTTGADDEMNANDGTYNGAVSIATGPDIGVANNKAADFSGISNYINVGTLENLGSNLANGVTIEMWLKSDGTAKQRPFGLWDSSGMSLSVAVDNPNDDNIWSGGQGGNLKVWWCQSTSDTNVTDGSWNYLAIAMDWDNDLAYTYMANLGDSSTTSITTAITTSAGPTFVNFTNDLFIGARRNSGSAEDPFDGLIDELAIYNKVLSKSDVDKHIAAIPEPSTLVLLALGGLSLLVWRRWRRK